MGSRHVLPHAALAGSTDTDDNSRNWSDRFAKDRMDTSYGWRSAGMVSFSP